MAIRAVFFDLDGTLLDTLRDLADAMNEVLAERGFAPHPIAPYRHFVGEGVRVLAERALPEEARGPEAVAGAARAMLEAYGRRWRRHTHPYPGVDAMLDGLAARGVPCAILSNKPDDFTRLTVDARLGRWSFAAVQGAKPGVPLKPDPTAALAMAAALGVPPEACLFVGDTPVDVATARAAGMVPVAVSWGFRDREELLRAGAVRLLETPADLLSLL